MFRQQHPDALTLERLVSSVPQYPNIPVPPYPASPKRKTEITQLLKPDPVLISIKIFITWQGFLQRWRIVLYKRINTPSPLSCGKLLWWSDR